MQTITRKGTFDSAHRVMNEAMKCFNLHGHTYHFELEFSFLSVADIGYAIDFKEIKRVGSQWIDDVLDHGVILNPHDTSLIETSRQLGSKMWLMSLNGADGYCNPSVENIAKEIYLALDLLFNDQGIACGLTLESITLYETPNCYTRCDIRSFSDDEIRHFYDRNKDELIAYRDGKGIMVYDDRLDGDGHGA